jgi:hypothetical protein
VLAWELVEEAWREGIPFRAVVADCIYGEHPTFTANLFCADIPYVVAIHSNHGVWQFVEDPAHPPAFNPHEAAERVPLERWERVVRQDSHGKELVHYVVELELGNAYGPRRNWRLIAATTDPRVLKKDATWYLLTTLPLQEASPQEVYQTDCLRDWVEMHQPHYPHRPARVFHEACRALLSRMILAGCRRRRLQWCRLPGLMGLRSHRSLMPVA